MTNQVLSDVSISLTKIRVKGYEPKKNSVDLEIFFEGVQSRKLIHSISLGRVQKTASQVIEAVISQERYLSGVFDGEKIREIPVGLRDKGKTMKTLVNFLRTLHSRSQRIRKTSFAAGYIDLIKSMQREEISLEDD